jgi:nucleoid-associated protein YgaU
MWRGASLGAKLQDSTEESMWGVPKLAIWVGAAVLAAIVGGVVAWQTEPPPSQPVKAGMAAVDQAPGSASGAAATRPTPAENLVAIVTPSAIPPATPPANPPASGLVVVQPSPAKPVAAILPQFDVVRVEPDGDAVIAGRAEPNAVVALLDHGQEIGHTTADDAGQFALLPKQLDHGDHMLSLRMTAKDRSSDSAQNVAVWIPSAPKGEVLVALTNPGEPTKILSDTPKPSAVPSNGHEAASTPLAIRSAEAEAQGSFYATGFAPPGARVILYLNNAYVASVTAGGDNRWSLKVEKGMKPGQYTIRADEIESSSGRVIARAEAPFSYPGLPHSVENFMEAGQNPAPRPDLRATMGSPPAVPPSAPRSKPPTTSAFLEHPEASTQAGAHAPQVRVAGRNGSSAPQAASILPPSAAPPSGVSDKSTNDSSLPKDGLDGKPQPPVTASAANAVVGELGTAIVERGDSLWRISRKIYGSGVRYTQIYEANAKQIRNPDLIYPGQIFVVPNRVAN